MRHACILIISPILNLLLYTPQLSIVTYQTSNPPPAIAPKVTNNPPRVTAMLNSTFPAGFPASDVSAGLEVSEPPPPPELVGEGVPGVEVTGSFASGLALTRTLSMIYHQLIP